MTYNETSADRHGALDSDAVVTVGTERRSTSHTAASVQAQVLRGFDYGAVGACILIVGILGLVYALFAPSAPEYSQTVNLGMLVDKIVVAVASSGLVIFGSIFSAAQAVMKAIARSRALDFGDQP